MEKFKIIFITGHCGTNIHNDNIDVNVVLENGNVYFGVLGTVENIVTFFNRGDLYYWSVDLLIVKDLSKETIRSAIQSAIDHDNLEYMFSLIGTIETIFKVNSFDEINDMNDEIAEYTK